ncbi:MAG: hypothetical protein DWQ28_06720, partial [Proteobacteria bacterium]
GFADDIGAKVGDQLTLRIAADEFEVTVASIRSVNWESMQPNFFVIFPEKLLDRFPTTLFTSFYLEPDEKYRVSELLDFMPTITLIEVDVAIQEIKTIIDQVSQAIELVLIIILVAGALVLIAGVSSSVDERLHESAILRALGAGRATLLGAVAIEFAAMGALAGVLAIMGSEAAGWVLQTQMLELDYQVQWLLWPLGIILGSLISSEAWVPTLVGEWCTHRHCRYCGSFEANCPSTSKTGGGIRQGRYNRQRWIILFCGSNQHRRRDNHSAFVLMFSGLAQQVSYRVTLFTELLCGCVHFCAAEFVYFCAFYDSVLTVGASAGE